MNNYNIQITNIKQFLEESNSETFYGYGRALYKYTFGPWIVAVLDNGEVYYESELARRTDWMNRCVGLRVGSIIEGADYDATPFEMMFPFTMAEYDKKLKELEEEVNFEWERNNLDYHICYECKRGKSGEDMSAGEWMSYEDNGDGSFLCDRCAIL